MKNFVLIVSALSFATALAVSTQSMAAPADDTARLASQYASWAGGNSNADALVNAQ